MTENHTCGTCKFRDIWGSCEKLTTIEGESYIEAFPEEIEYPGVRETYRPEIDYIETSPNFGCVLWEDCEDDNDNE